MLTGISGSKTVLMASTNRRLQRRPSSPASATSAVRLVGRRPAPVGPAPGNHRQRFHSSTAFSVVAICSRSSAALSVCHARLAHFTRTGNSRTPASDRELAHVLHRLIGRRRHHRVKALEQRAHFGHRASLDRCRSSARRTPSRSRSPAPSNADVARSTPSSTFR